MDDPVPPAEKSAWIRELIRLQEPIGRRNHESLVGRRLPVLAEGPGRGGDGYLTGRDAHNTIVEFPGDAGLVGRFVDVRVTRAMNWAVTGELFCPAKPNLKFDTSGRP
jgi:tRNA-2-methylthio-N6-dimethylallyladenosine synthase